MLCVLKNMVKTIFFLIGAGGCGDILLRVFEHKETPFANLPWGTSLIGTITMGTDPGTLFGQSLLMFAYFWFLSAAVASVTLWEVKKKVLGRSLLIGLLSGGLGIWLDTKYGLLAATFGVTGSALLLGGLCAAYLFVRTKPVPIVATPAPAPVTESPAPAPPKRRWRRSNRNRSKAPAGGGSES